MARAFPANLTPGPNTGLCSGVWTEKLFIKTLSTGKHTSTARDILPPTPWQFYGQPSDDDLKAIWASPGRHRADRQPRARPDPAPGRSDAATSASGGNSAAAQAV